MKDTSLPDYVAKYFWGDNLLQLSQGDNESYIIQTILDIGDQKAVKWLLSKLNRDSIKAKLPELNLSSKSANFWNIYLS